MRLLLLLMSSGCLVTSVEGTTHQPEVGEFHECTIERYCGGSGTQQLDDAHLCADDTDELENRVAFECWDSGGECSGGFCHVVCKGTGVACVFVPQDR